jgi:hypothetical protein
MIDLRRDALLRSLENSAKGGHLVVVGEPGAGKSWLLKEFVARRKGLGDGVVFLRAEDYAVTSLSDLLRSIGTADFFAALRGYPGERKFLVIDSLDSLRAEGSQRAFRDLIHIVQSEVPAFTVVLSIRTFDMQRSPELQELFPLNNESPFSPLSSFVRHFVVPVFSETELDEAVAQEERLRPIVASASRESRTLLYNPFNLWLVIHLVDAGVSVDWLSAIQSEVQLLDRYWLYRIDSREDSVSKNALLATLTERMVDSRLMSVALRDFEVSETPDKPLNSLLSDEILSRNENGRISYTHNILFDFAVSKLLLDEQNVMAFVFAAPARGIFYRPSISYFMARLWFRDRTLFWKSTEQFFERRRDVPAVVAITAARAVFDLVQTKDDLLPLFAMSPETRLRATVFSLRAIQALNGLNSKKRYVWISFLINSFDYLDKRFLNESVGLIEGALQDAAPPLEVRVLSLAAIQLLRWIWRNAEIETDIADARSLADFAAARLIPIAAKHYQAIPSEAKEILTEALGRFNNPRSSANEAFRIASNLDSVIEGDPEFTSEIYVAILGHEEMSEEQTHMGGAVLPLLSTRAQDFSLAYYVLGVKFKYLMDRDLIVAARTAGRSVTAQVKRKEGETINALRAYNWTFQFLGKTITLNSDRSEIWDHSDRDYTAIQLVDSLLYALKSKLTSGQLSAEGARSALCELGEYNIFAVTWKRILTFASHTVEVLAIIPDLLRIPELLAAPETTAAAGMAIAKAYEQDIFTPDEFAGIQDAILSIPKLPLGSIFRDPFYVRDALLACIPVEKLDADAKAVFEGRKQTSAARPAEGFVQMGQWSSEPDSEQSWLKRQGVETERDDNRILLAATRSLKAFESQFVNQVPPKEKGESIVEDLWNAYSLVERTKTADERVVTEALTTVAAVAQEVLKNKEFAEDSQVVFRCKTIVAKAAEYPFPIPREDADANFDRPAWSPTPKIEAARGVMNYLGNWGTDQELKSLAEKLSSDPSPAVRLQIAMNLAYLYEKNRDSFWRIANARLPLENATAVLASMAQSVTHAYIAKRERDAVIEWQNSLLQRELPSGRTDDVLKVIAHSLTDLFVFFGDAHARKALEVFEKQPSKYVRELSQMTLSATNYLADGLGNDDQAKSDIRARARAVWKGALTCADLMISEYFNSPKATSPEENAREQETLKGALTVIDNAVFQLYLLFRVNKNLVRENLPSLDDSRRKLLFFELEPIWKLLLGPIGPQHKGLLPARTTHHLMELFRTTVSFDPPRILQLAADLFKGFNMGYQSDQMAIGEIVQFAEVILADHKETLRDPINASNLASILDQFVEAGWAQATQLVMKLDGAVR